MRYSPAAFFDAAALSVCSRGSSMSEVTIGGSLLIDRAGAQAQVFVGVLAAE
jgi:hypothetical protein